MLRCFCWFVLALLGCPWLWAQAKVTQEEVLLTWNPPIFSADLVAGYNAYRVFFGINSFEQLNLAVITATSFIDLTVQPLTTYEYVVKSVDAAGGTSDPSNEVEVVIPNFPQPPVLGTVSVTVNP
jgi:fibronectin type 3 domain-containing protein